MQKVCYHSSRALSMKKLENFMYIRYVPPAASASARAGSGPPLPCCGFGWDFSFFFYFLLAFRVSWSIIEPANRPDRAFPLF